MRGLPAAIGLTKEPVTSEIGPGKIERPPLPAKKGLNVDGLFRLRAGRGNERIHDERGLVVLPRPKIEQSPAENQSIAGVDHVVDHRLVLASADGMDGSAITSNRAMNHEMKTGPFL